MGQLGERAIYNVPVAKGSSTLSLLTHQISVFEHLLVPGGGQLKVGRGEVGMGEGRADSSCTEGTPWGLPAPLWVSSIPEGSLGYLQPGGLASGR